MTDKKVKLNKEFFEDMKKSSLQEKENAQRNFERQHGVFALCEWILANVDFEGEKGELNVIATDDNTDSVSIT